MLSKVKLSLRISDTDYDTELEDLIAEAMADMESRGIQCNVEDHMMQKAIKAYCKAYFGNPDKRTELIEIYEDIVHRLQNTDGYTDWGE